jgi:hypothetical protein
MSLSGSVSESDWSVCADVRETSGGFDCLIRVARSGPEHSFAHEFKQSRAFRSEREAVLEGLREGMVWIDLRMSNAFSL